MIEDGDKRQRIAAHIFPSKSMNTKDLQEQLSTAWDELIKGNYAEAEGLAQRVLSELETEAAPPDHFEDASALLVLRAEATRLLSVKAWLRGSNISALEYGQAALSLAELSGDRSMQAKVMNNIGNVYDSLSDHPNALDYYARALSQHEEIGNKSGTASVSANIGTVYKSLSDYPKALEYYARALSQHEEVGDKRGAANATGNIGIVYRSLCDYPKALEYYVRALSMHEEVGDKRGAASVSGNIGNVYNLLSDYPTALEYYARALSQHEELSNKSGAADVTCNIGNVYYSLADYHKALEYYARAQSKHEEVGDKASAARLTGLIGNVYKSLSDYQKALEYHARALSQHEEAGDKAGVANVIGNMGCVYLSILDYQKAHEYLSRGLQLQVELGLKANAAYTRAVLADLYANEANAERDESTAEKYLRESIAANEDLSLKRYEAHETLAELYERQGRWQEANTELKRYHELKEQVRGEEAQKSAVIMEQRKQIAEREKEFQLAKAAANAKHQATQELLYNVLPPSIAHRMIEGESLIAEKLDCVSVLFADIVNFTKLSQRITADELVAGLDRIFSAFDTLAEKHGLEKIKTIGDAYMVVSGAPKARADHAEAMAAFALEILEAMKEFTSISTGEQIQLRIGIHSGAVVAGVIGKKKFAYDLWGDTVNTASRMESHGEAGRIHVSEEFVNHLTQSLSHAERHQTKSPSLQGKAGMGFIERGEMEIKGKGIMRTFFLEKAQ